jgi:serine/threonine protein kinase/class 3 adenylate cyclase/sugar lactone lactonase YvrE
MKAPEASAVGELLREHRLRRGWTQEELAERAAISPRSVSDLERGAERGHYPHTIYRLAEALGLEADERAAFETAARVPQAPPGSPSGLPAEATSVLTFMFSDVRGYTRFTHEQGDEAGAHLAAKFAAVTRETIAARGGRLVELRGDGALSVFSSARQAVRAAVDLQVRFAQETAEDPATPMPVGIALDAGEAVPVEGGYRGGALNLAARLCAIAGSGEVFVSEGLVHLARKIEGLAYVERGYEQLKGISEPVRVIAVAPESEVAARSAAEAEAVTRLPVGNFLGAVPAGKIVARDEEMRQITGVLESVAGGDGQLLLIVGERGVGKTRLAQEASVEARSRGFLVATGRCYESQRALPYYPFLEALSHLLQAAPAPLRGVAGKRWPHLARLIPDELPGAPTPDTDPREEQARLYRAVTGFVTACAEHAPVALLLDDLQWADERSLDLLAHLTRNTRAGAVLLLGTYLDVDLSTDHRLGKMVRELGRERLLERISLRRLGMDGTAELMSSIMGETFISPELVELVHRRTRGRPLFVEEMVRALGGRYQLVCELGAGGMGRVFQAIDTRDDSPVAVKILFASTEAGIEALLRFQQEGAVLSTLKHPNIVEVKGTFLEEHISCIIMELLDGRSLAQVLRDGSGLTHDSTGAGTAEPAPTPTPAPAVGASSASAGRAERGAPAETALTAVPASRPTPDLARIKRILSQVTAALVYAHSRNIVHRDLKPDNIMVLDGDAVKVTDFGIARVLGTAATLNTATGMTVGTPLYMAPEQIEGREVDGRADIYALGAVLYQMVTGKPPFEGADPITTGIKHLREAPQPPADIAADLPPDWEELILRMLAKDPADRPQTARELGDAIAALSTEPVAPGSRTRATRVRAPTPAAAPRERTPTFQPMRIWIPPGWITSRLRPLTSRVPMWLLSVAASLVVVAIVAAIVLLTQGSGSSSAPPPKSLAAVAGWGSSTTANSADTAIRITARGVTVSNALPDGSTAARCFIQVTARSGVQRNRFGNCAGIALTVTCSSASYNLDKLAPSGRGASISINGKPAWTGAYDQGTSPPCPNHPKGINDSLAAHLAGTTAGQNIVWLVGGDNQGHINTTGAVRSGCFAYLETAGASASRCVQTDYTRKVGSFFDEVAARGTAGDFVETGTAAFSADLTLQGVFLAPPAAHGALPDSLHSPAGVGVDAAGNVYVADSGANLVEKLSPAGKPLARWSGAGRNRFSNPQAVAVDGSGNVYVADQNNNRVVKLSPSGRLIAPWGTGDSGPSSLNAPIALAVDGDGNVWVLDASTPPLHELSPAGKQIKQLQPGNVSSTVFYGIALDSHGHMYVAPGVSGGVSVFATSSASGAYPTNPISTFGTYGGRRGQLRSPGGIALDPQGDIYVTDTGNNRIAVFTSAGKWLFAAGKKGKGVGKLDSPGGIAVDDHGNVYVADTNNDRVQKFVAR